MASVFSGLAVLACPLGMGLMMWMMMRGQPQSGDQDSRAQVDRLGAEIEALKSARAVRTPGDWRS